MVFSPIGCVRDRIESKHFAENICNFQCETGVTVEIVSYNQDSKRELRNGLSHSTFIQHLHNNITAQLQPQHNGSVSLMLTSPGPGTEVSETSPKNSVNFLANTQLQSKKTVDQKTPAVTTQRATLYHFASTTSPHTPPHEDNKTSASESESLVIELSGISDKSCVSDCSQVDTPPPVGESCL